MRTKSIFLLSMSLFLLAEIANAGCPSLYRSWDVEPSTPELMNAAQLLSRVGEARDHETRMALLDEAIRVVTEAIHRGTTGDLYAAHADLCRSKASFLQRRAGGYEESLRLFKQAARSYMNAAELTEEGDSKTTLEICAMHTLEFGGEFALYEALRARLASDHPELFKERPATRINAGE